MVSVTQPLAHLARHGAEPLVTRMNRVLLISKQYSVRIVGLGRGHSHWYATYPGARK